MKPENSKNRNVDSLLIEKLSSLGSLSNSTRAGILIVLLALKKATFTDILTAVKVSKSSLSTSLSLLEKSGYIRIEHGFLRRGGPRTIIIITNEGEKAIVEYLDLMGELAKLTSESK